MITCAYDPVVVKWSWTASRSPAGRRRFFLVLHVLSLCVAGFSMMWILLAGWKTITCSNGATVEVAVLGRTGSIGAARGPDASRSRCRTYSEGMLARRAGPRRAPLPVPGSVGAACPTPDPRTLFVSIRVPGAGISRASARPCSGAGGCRRWPADCYNTCGFWI